MNAQEAFATLGPSPLDLPDDRYWSDEAERAMEGLFSERVVRNDYGPLIAAPSLVALDARATAPLVGCHTMTLRDVRAYDVARVAIVVAVCVETNEVFASRALPPPEPQPVEDVGEIDDGGTGVTFALDLFENPGLPRRPATYDVVVIVRDRVSNRVRVRLGPSPAAYQDPEVLRFLEEANQRPAMREPWPAPGDPLPSFDARATRAPLPKDPGIALAIDRVVMLGPNARAVLSGAFRLPLLRREIAPASTPAPAHAAVRGVTLVVTGADVGGPLLFRLAAPITGAVESSPDGSVGVGYFALDLLALPGMWRSARTHFIYAFSGPHATGPTTMAFVTPDMLPPTASR